MRTIGFDRLAHGRHSNPEMKIPGYVSTVRARVMKVGTLPYRHRSTTTSASIRVGNARITFA